MAPAFEVQTLSQTNERRGRHVKKKVEEKKKKHDSARGATAALPIPSRGGDYQTACPGHIYRKALSSRGLPLGFIFSPQQSLQ